MSPICGSILPGPLDSRGPPRLLVVEFKLHNHAFLCWLSIDVGRCYGVLPGVTHVLHIKLGPLHLG